jgi:general secretion pathway protein J
MQRRSKVAGFTLIELLIALALLALTATLAWRGLDIVTRQRDALQVREALTQDMQRTVAQIQADFDYLIDPRTLGAGVNLEAVQERDGVLTLLRSPRNGGADIEMVRYVVFKGKLKRVSFKLPDAIAVFAAVNNGELGAKDAKNLLDAQGELKVEVWRDAGASGKRWAPLADPNATPSAAEGTPVAPPARMQAIRLKFTLSEGRALEKVFLLERSA